MHRKVARLGLEHHLTCSSFPGGLGMERMGSRLSAPKGRLAGLPCAPFSTSALSTCLGLGDRPFFSFPKYLEGSVLSSLFSLSVVGAWRSVVTCLEGSKERPPLVLLWGKKKQQLRGRNCTRSTATARIPH